MTHINDPGDPGTNRTTAETTGTTRATADPNASRSTAALLSDALAHVSGLIRKEMDLARAEMSGKITQAGVAVGMIVGAVVLLLTALNVLSAALVAGLARWMAGEGADEAALASMTGWAALIVGVIYFVIALILAKKGMNDLKATNLAPTRTAENVKRDAHAVKESVNG